MADNMHALLPPGVLHLVQGGALPPGAACWDAGALLTYYQLQRNKIVLGYNKEALQLHPDRGGSNAQFSRLTEARNAALLVNSCCIYAVRALVSDISKCWECVVCICSCCERDYNQCVRCASLFNDLNYVEGLYCTYLLVQNTFASFNDVAVYEKLRGDANPNNFRDQLLAIAIHGVGLTTLHDSMMDKVTSILQSGAKANSSKRDREAAEQEVCDGDSCEDAFCQGITKMLNDDALLNHTYAYGVSDLFCYE